MIPLFRYICQSTDGIYLKGTELLRLKKGFCHAFSRNQNSSSPFLHHPLPLPDIPLWLCACASRTQNSIYSQTYNFAVLSSIERTLQVLLTGASIFGFLFHGYCVCATSFPGHFSAEERVGARPLLVRTFVELMCTPKY